MSPAVRSRALVKGLPAWAKTAPHCQGDVSDTLDAQRPPQCCQLEHQPIPLLGLEYNVRR